MERCEEVDWTGFEGVEWMRLVRWVRVGRVHGATKSGTGWWAARRAARINAREGRIAEDILSGDVYIKLKESVARS